MKFEREAYNQVDWDLLDSFGDRTFSQRRAWLEFICETQAGEAVLARLEDEGRTLGFFSGVVIRRMGMRIMGSPFPGWTTPYIGLNLFPGVPRAVAVAALIPFVFRTLNCQHLEIADPFLTQEDMAQFGFEVQIDRTFRSDLTRTDDQLFADMDSACRRCIRKAEKSGVTVEEADPRGFAKDYFAQIEDVFAKQGLKPTYGRDRVDALVRHVYPTGNLLLLRARDGDGRSIATGIFSGFNAVSYFWGNGSLRQHQIVRPNEAIHWHAMKYWKRKGIQWHYWGGGGEYKKKYGGDEVPYIQFRLSRHAMIALARDMARKLYYFPRGIRRNHYIAKLQRGGHAT
jgi:Acetyltransferase (GNAT) domain